ncbi:MAG: efflux RND transporter permease subunit [Spirulinaceae cyanobacterium]
MMVKPFYRNIRLLILTFILIIAWGILSFQSLPQQEDPELVSRVAVVKTAFPGASAERVEALVTEALEGEITEIEEIDTLQSDSRVGFSTVTIELVDSVANAQLIWSKVRDKINDASAFFPPGAGVPELEEVKIKAYTAIASLTWNQPSEPNYSVLRRYAEQLEVAMRGVEGTEEAKSFGAPNEEITVEINAPDLVTVGLSPQELAEQINFSDAKVTAGQFRSDRSNIAIEVDSELATIERIRQIPIQSNAGQFTRLSDIAQVNRTILQPPTNLALVSGKPAIVVGIIIKSGLKIGQWTEDVKAEIARFEAGLPQGVSLDLIFDQSEYVEARIGSLISNLVVGALLVVGVNLVSMGWRSSLVVGVALPLTTCMVFGWMSLLNIPIHQMSVTGLIIALGLLIDNAIVVVDEIQVEMQHGAKPLEALLKTVNYLKVPLFASTITTVLTFLPIVLLPGAAGEFVRSIALSVIMALISSLALSLTVIASLAARMLARSPEEAEQLKFKKTQPQKIIQKIKTFLSRPEAWWNQGFTSRSLARPYRQSLKFTASKPLLAIALTFCIPLIGFISAKTLDNQFFPSVSRDQFQIEVEFASSTAIAETEAKMLQGREIILANPLVKDVHWFMGESAPKFYYNFTGNRQNQSNYAQAMVQLNTDQDLEAIVQELQNELDVQFPSARILVRQLQQGPPYDAPVEMRIFGPNLAELRRLGMEVRGILATVPDVIHVRDDLTEALPKLGLSVDEEQAKQAGLTNTAIAQQLEAYLEGAIGGSILEATENLPVRVRVSNVDRADLSQIASIDLSAKGGGNSDFVSTSALGEFNLTPELANIARYNEQRVNTVQGYITAGVLPAAVLAKFQAELAANKFQLPSGYRYEFGGEQEQSSQAQGNLAQYVPLLLVVMITALVLSLGSFRQAGIVGGVAVGCIGTALFSLKVASAPLGFMAIIGIMGLVGIAINDTVIVLSALNEHPQAREGNPSAIEDVVVNATRHVITTTVTTIAGFIPLLVSGGPFWQPLAIAIAGGISGSSLLALYFVPAVYLIIKGKPKPHQFKRQYEPSLPDEQKFNSKPQTIPLTTNTIMTKSTVTIFSKPNCQYCVRAKALLDYLEVKCQEYDVTASQRNADASVYFSGVATVPQIFIGNYHINGAEDLEKLETTGRLEEILEIAKGDLALDTFSAQELHQGAKDVPLREYIPMSDGSRDQDDESLPILHFYKEFFGFWPHTFAYLHHWQEAYKLFVYCHNFSAVGYGKHFLSMKLMSAIGYATSHAHGCSYCQVHSAAAGGEQSQEIVKQLKQGHQGNNSLFNSSEIALVDLAAAASKNAVDKTLLASVQNTDASLQNQLEGTKLITAAFGFLNVFNDLTGLEIEGDWASQAQEKVGIEPGRHGKADANPNNLDYEIAKGDLSIQDMLAKYDYAIDDLETYAQEEFGLFPAWMQNWTQPLQKRHAYLYGELMGDRRDSLISSELKHLMARVSAIAKGHDYLAAVEGYMAHHTASNQEKVLERIRQCFVAATSQEDTSSIFKEKEQAALKLAWLSAQVPLTTPYKFIKPVIEFYQPQELIHLIVVCSVASMVQRFVAIDKTAMETEVSQFYIQHSMATNSFQVRYSLSVNQPDLAKKC